MRDPLPSPREESGRGDEPTPGEPQSPSEYPRRIPPPPPPEYYPPLDYTPPYGEPESSAPGGYGPRSPYPREPYRPAGPYADSYPPTPVPVEHLYTEPRPQRKWIRIPLDRPVFTMVTLVVLVGIYIPVLFSEEIRNAFYTYGQKENALIVEGEWWRLITATLLHGPPYHILFNGYALYILGNDLEAFFGRWRFLAVYWLSALAGSVASFAFSPAPSIGASGAVFGLIGALAVYFGIHRRLFGRIGQTQFWNIIVVIVLNIGLGLSQILPIDNSAHIGGLVAGAAVGLALSPHYAFGNWRTPNVREVRNINYGRLTWIAVAIIALDILFAFFVALLLYQKGYWEL